MQTLYIDVYFLINLSVDSLAMYFASRLVGIRIHLLRLLISNIILSLVSCLYILYFEGKMLGYIFVVISYLLATLICTKAEGAWKWVALSLAFLIFSFMIGGIVFWGYEKLNILFEKMDINIKNGAENKKLMLFLGLILLCVCILNLLISFLERKKNDSERLPCIFFSGREIPSRCIGGFGMLAGRTSIREKCISCKKTFSKILL